TSPALYHPQKETTGPTKFELSTTRCSLTFSLQLSFLDHICFCRNLDHPALMFVAEEEHATVARASKDPAITALRSQSERRLKMRLHRLARAWPLLHPGIPSAKWLRRSRFLESGKGSWQQSTRFQGG